jgi:hypothetical protein
MNNSTEAKFRKQLLELCEGDKKRFLMQKDQYYNLIAELKEADQTETKSRRQYYITGRLAAVLLNSIHVLYNNIHALYNSIHVL